jgi:hypothetical protein
MSNKRVPIGHRPVTDPSAEMWVRKGDGVVDGPIVTRATTYTARLTIDVTPALRGRIKVAAFRQGVTVADLLRALLEREFPDQDDIV